MQFLRKFFAATVSQPVPAYRLSDDELVYAVGDIHGRVDLLEQLLDIIAADRKARWNVENCTLVFLGDYVDRGFHSKDVIDKLIGLKPDWADVVCLKGNHELMMLDFMSSPAANESWLKHGGLATLASYGIALQQDGQGKPDLKAAAAGLRQAVPATHTEFMRSSPCFHTVGDYLFVHAGIRPGRPLHAQDPFDMMSIRHEFTQSNKDFGFRVVHGHTGVQNPEARPNRIAVDTIAYATGRLTAVALQGEVVDFLST